MQNEKGFSLIEVLMSSAIVGIIAMAFAFFMADSYRRSQYFSAKTDIVAFKGQIVKVFSNASICGCNMSAPGLHFDTTSPSLNTQVFQIGNLKSGCTATSPFLAEEGAEMPTSLSKVTIDKVNLTDVQASGSDPNLFLGNIQVSFFSNSLPSFAPIKVPILLQLNSADPVSAKSIVGCFGSSTTGSGVACVSGKYSVYNDTGTMINSGSLSPTPAFADVFETSPNVPSDPTLWGIRCNPGWAMTSCSISNGTNAIDTLGSQVDYDVRISSEGFCSSDDEERDPRATATMYLICCK